MTNDLACRRRSPRGALMAYACLLTLAVLGCGGAEPVGAQSTATSALTTVEKTNTARASVYTAEVARYRAAAAAQRQQAAAYARWTPKAGETVTTNWNEKLKATRESRAAAAEQIAADIQTLVDFHTAEASKETVR